ncbi:MAG TPA: divalent metal cation transporter [Chthoniobacteraceae bacterium]|nr:divalent metal cation transporter [Chthoniobacteraceae bacterium]
MSGLKRKAPWKRFFSILGPGLVTGAADDDPSGIATYTVVGAQMGTALLWTAFITLPLMGAVQMMCARIGLATGEGIAGALRSKFPRWAIACMAGALVVANTINIGADFEGMADAAQMLSGISGYVWIPLMAAAIVLAMVFFNYAAIVNILKWLTLVLFAYVITAFILHPQWGAVLRDTFIPSWPKGHDAWAGLVAILGTTISPYLFFWQASQEVEIKKTDGKRKWPGRRATWREIVDRKIDVGVGAFVSNIVMYFIILSAALTLHKSGQTHVETSRQASEALRPLAGPLAATLYTAGIVGVGFLAIPALAGSTAYALAETFRWRQGLNERFRRAGPFYIVIIVSILAGTLFYFLGINPVKALFWTAVINGLLAPFLLAGILAVACDARVMRSQPSSMTGRWVVAVTVVIMFAAGIGMILV